MDTLSKIFGSELRVRAMRLFLFNPDGSFDADFVAAKTGEKPKAVEREFESLKRLGLIKSTRVFKTFAEKRGKKVVHVKRAVKAWSLDRGFPFAEALSDFLARTNSMEKRSIVKRLEKAGRLKAVLVSGMFTRDGESRLDLFVVADNVKSSAMDRIVKGIESDMGKDLRYAVLSAPDFAYRVSMNDKLVRDVLDFPHEVLVDKIGISNA